ncbi:hypothetical protein GCM10010331_49610 [Streptomyces xanthochromogenes]|uniref:hypothetical protein n=1 Tax=Streptomyces xanthochromogenes TaxID=67384 RepID=UPI001998A9C2|nr:hypothetical protein [Streptomyces xanthochromogenes]GHB55826.1 hypothetical protein GCM10010331_49610 [Streptomyces xanthochromogenes]
MTSPQPPRRFYLQRDIDITGVSGTGRVADGVLWPDGTASVRWLGERPSSVHWDRMDDAEHVHGHGGATRIIWLDHETSEVDENAPCAHCPDGHGAPTRCSWAVHVDAQRDGDGQPVRLVVQPTAGQHVAPEDAVWLRQLIRWGNAEPQP